MQSVAMPGGLALAAWRNAARSLLSAGVPPADVMWLEGDRHTLFSAWRGPAASVNLKVPRQFLELCETVICHIGPERFSCLYSLLWHLQSNPRLLEDASDPNVARSFAMEKSVRRDAHKMKAFVRFKDAGTSKTGRRRFVAWFEPDHHIVERTAPFFTRRFADMDWIIATPKLSARFEDNQLSFEKTAGKPADISDDVETLWRAYYANIFNPARLKVKAMEAEMPRKYWKNLPEATLIPGLIAGAQRRVKDMQARGASMPSPKVMRIQAATRPAIESQGNDGLHPHSLAMVQTAAETCQRCPLYANATQTVFGEGPEDAVLMFVGEQPGDKEDLSGRPFVGPAGQLFDHILGDAGIDRAKCYITNAVKHFKYELRGKFRLHKRPDASEVQACQWWVKLEQDFVKPRLIVALGATAALSLTGEGSAVLKRRGQLEITKNGTKVFITVHPSSLLRMPDADSAQAARLAFRRDLELIRNLVPEVALAAELLTRHAAAHAPV
jgi:uracil-DNA glycosylase